MKRLKSLISYDDKDVFTLQNLEKYNVSYQLLTYKYQSNQMTVSHVELLLGQLLTFYVSTHSILDPSQQLMMIMSMCLCSYNDTT